MGTFQHKTLLVIGDDKPVERLHAMVERRNKALEKAGESPIPVTPVTPVSNGYHCFSILPSGSKVGWARHQDSVDMIEDIQTAVKDGSLSGHVIAGYLEFGELDSHGFIVSPAGTERLVSHA